MRSGMRFWSGCWIRSTGRHADAIRRLAGAEGREHADALRHRRHIGALRDRDPFFTRSSRVGLRLSAIEQTSGNLDALSGSDRETVRSLIR
ncbi:hypothetical protein THIOKS12860026 [Thiocapsa sp. KS1]|nr:hypothetical protein THIOKS12860026 [Thiocapsa sp. KS1]